jgi:hypothetical protein
VKSTNNTKVDAALKLHARELRHNDRKGNRLKREKAITLKSLANVKDMDVILHGLCPVPINR